MAGTRGGGRSGLEPDARDSRTTLAWWWVLVPLVTLGLGAGIPFLVLATRVRSRRFALVATAYIVLALVSLSLLNVGGSKDTWQSGLGSAIAITCAFVGSVHVYLVCRQPSSMSIFMPRSRTRWSSFPRVYTNSSERSEYMIGRAVERMNLRDDARRIAKDQPRLADELRIGRPDLPREYDDGGLVDINHVPLSVLVQLPSVSRELALQIVNARTTVGGFESLDDVSIVLGIPPQELDHLRDVIICRR